jgi:hypothetical protein
MKQALPFTGTLTMGEALAGFGDPNIVLIAAPSVARFLSQPLEDS